jgi:hypothetical protein
MSTALVTFASKGKDLAYCAKGCDWLHSVTLAPRSLFLGCTASFEKISGNQYVHGNPADFVPDEEIMGMMAPVILRVENTRFSSSTAFTSWIRDVSRISRQMYVRSRAVSFVRLSHDFHFLMPHSRPGAQRQQGILRRMLPLYRINRYQRIFVH